MRTDDILNNSAEIDINLLVEYINILERKFNQLEKNCKNLEHEIINLKIDYENAIRRIEK